MKLLNYKNIKHNVLYVTFLRLLIIALIYSICRVSFYLFNISSFPDMTFFRMLKIMVGGLKFDISAICYTNLLWLLLCLIPFLFRYKKGYQKVIKYLFFITNGIAIFANCADFIYFPYVQKRTTSTIFNEFSNEGASLLNIALRFIVDYYYVALFYLALMWLLIFLYNKTKAVACKVSNYKKYYIYNSLIIPFAIFFIIAGCRGTFVIPTFPITLSNALASVERPIESAIVLNTPFSIIRTLGKKDFERKSYYKSEEELEKNFNPIVELKNDKFTKKNVVYIILESFSREYFGLGNEHINNGTYKGFTPFLDSLFSKHCYTFINSYSNGTKSIEGVPAIVSGIPSTKEPYFTYHQANNKINSIAHILSKEGYETAFFLGAPNGSMNFTQYAKVAGYKSYFGMDNYLDDGGSMDDYDGYWGIWDHKFLPYAADKISTFKEPFFSSIFTVNSHNPYKIPEEFEGKLRTGNMKMLQSINYTDTSLKMFFEKIKSLPWYENTIFAFCADHSAVSDLREYKTSVNKFAVLIAIFDPSKSESHIVDRETVVQQVDITPTVLNLLGYSGKFVSFGHNVLDKEKENFAFNYYNGVYQLITNDLVLQFDEKKTIAVYEYKKDVYLKHNIINKYPEVQLKMEKKLKAFIQQYNNRMLDNKLVLDDEI